jgi:hypothetical protein
MVVVAAVVVAAVVMGLQSVQEMQDGATAGGYSLSRNSQQKTDSLREDPVGKSCVPC